MRIVGDHIILRTVTPSDLEVLMKWENDSSLANYNAEKEPVTRETMASYVSGIHDIYMDHQLRFMITLSQSEEVVGTVDLFDYDQAKSIVGTGIVIFDSELRGKNIGSEAMDMLLQYANSHLKVEKVFCNIAKHNKKSIAFFTAKNFEEIPENTPNDLSDKRLSNMNLYYYNCPDQH